MEKPVKARLSKKEKSDNEKAKYLNEYNNNKEAFFTLQKNIALNFQEYSYYDIVNLKTKLQCIESELKKNISKLYKKFKIIVKIENITTN